MHRWHNIVPELKGLPALLTAAGCRVLLRAAQEARQEFRPAGLPWDWHLPAVPRLPSHRPSEALRPRQTMREMLSHIAPRLTSQAPGQ